MREKLIELLHKGVRCPGTVADCTDCPHHSFHVPCDEFGATADMLIANDVVPVVRCKDCKNWMYEYDDVGLCVTDVPDIDGVQRLACDFCSYGERRTDD